MSLAIGIDIGGTKTNLGVISKEGTIKQLTTISTEAQNPNQLTEDLLAELTKLITSYPQVNGIGIASAGRINFNNQVLYATDNLQGWTDVPIVEIIKQEFELPTYLDNDVNAALNCDLKLNPNYQTGTTIFITIGTGLGGAVSIEGEILRGSTGSVGEFGHMTLYPEGVKCNCGKQGCVEQYISGTAYRRRLKDKLTAENINYTPQDLTPAVIEEKINAGSKPYTAVLSKMTQDLALLLENLKNCLDFDRCLIGGSFTVYEEIMLPQLEEYFATYGGKYNQQPNFIFSHQGNKAGVIGAGLLAV